MYLTALIKSKAGHAADLKPFLLDLVKASRAEEGCLQYDLHQSNEDENLFIFHEQWKDEEALMVHYQQPHLQQLVKVGEELIEGEIIIYKHEKLV